MLSTYIVAALVGGLLIVLSVVGGIHHGDSDVGADGHDGIDHGHDGVDAHEGPWIPFFSVRFWTYFASTFGICGLLLSLLVKTPEPTSALLSGGAGLIVGLLVAYGMRALSRTDTDSSIAPKDLMGREATVVVAIRGRDPGRVRVSVKGEILELLATCEEDFDLEAGSRALVVDMEGDKVKVMSYDTALEQLEQTKQ